MELKGHDGRNISGSAFLEIIKDSIGPWTLHFRTHTEMLACYVLPTMNAVFMNES